MLVAERFIQKLDWLQNMANILYVLMVAVLGIRKPVNSRLDHHHLYSSFEKNIIIERTIRYIKDRTKSFDD
jgi:hypothetical protein